MDMPKCIFCGSEYDLFYMLYKIQKCYDHLYYPISLMNDINNIFYKFHNISIEDYDKLNLIYLQDYKKLYPNTYKELCNDFNYLSYNNIMIYSEIIDVLFNNNDIIKFDQIFENDFIINNYEIYNIYDKEINLLKNIYNIFKLEFEIPHS